MIQVSSNDQAALLTMFISAAGPVMSAMPTPIL